MIARVSFAALLLPLALGAPTCVKSGSSSLAVDAVSTSSGPTSTVLSSSSGPASTVVSSSSSSSAASATSTGSAQADGDLTCTPSGNLTNFYAVVQTSTEGGRVITPESVILGVNATANEYGSLAVIPCYDDAEACDTSSFSFETCRTQDAYTTFGHVLYTNSTANTTQCVAASGFPFNGTSIQLADCVYDLPTVQNAGQWWLLQTQSADSTTLYLYDGSETNIFGPTPDLANNASLTFYSALLDATDGTYFTFDTLTNSTSSD